MNATDLKVAEGLGRLLQIPLSGIEQWMGNLFHRKVQPLEIESMSFHKLKYWNSWHERIEDAEVKAYKTPTKQ